MMQAKALADQQSHEIPEPGTLPLGRIGGISLRIHVAFLAVALLFGAINHGLDDQTGWLFLVIGLCGSFLLHDLGHALMARRCGHIVRTVVLHPLRSGVRIEGALTARDEISVAFAGPLANALLAALLWGWHRVVGTAIVQPLFLVNLLLCLVNLIPALPWDGGRALRAFLTPRRGRVAATELTAIIGTVCAFGCVAASLISGAGVLLAIVAVSISLGTAREVQAERWRAALEGKSTEAATTRTFTTLSPGDSLQHACQRFSTGARRDFPVLLGEQIVGILRWEQLRDRGEGIYISEVMDRRFATAQIDAPLDKILAQMRAVSDLPILVLQEEHLVGMITNQSLSKLLRE